MVGMVRNSNSSFRVPFYRYTRITPETGPYSTSSVTQLEHVCMPLKVG